MLERRCQLVVTVVYLWACRPLCSTGAVWAFWGDPGRQKFSCGLFTTGLIATPASAVEDVIFYATWTTPGSVLIQFHGCVRMLLITLEFWSYSWGFAFLTQGNIFHTAWAVKWLTAHFTVSFEVCVPSRCRNHPQWHSWSSRDGDGTACSWRSCWEKFHVRNASAVGDTHPTWHWRA